MARTNIFDKDPDAVLDYQLDWSDWLPDGDTIATSVWSVPVGLTEDSDTNTTTTATVWLSGGTAGTEYQVANTITTADGRTDERTIKIKVVER
jgi:hypothetical protein